MTGLIVAIDTADLLRAQLLVSLLRTRVGMFKIGSAFFCAHGPEGVRRLELPGTPWMLDLKLHDIPSTVAAAVQAVLPLRPTFLTVHAAGGEAMMTAAIGALEEMSSPKPKILAVAALTSRHTISDFFDLAVDTAINADVDGIVCPARWAKRAKACLESRIVVCPGIRRPEDRDDDHLFGSTPRQAAQAGADWIVVGRPITQADDPVVAAQAIVTELNGA
jgi:orotidine-5'-phosphate decarboxylase